MPETVETSSSTASAGHFRILAVDDDQDILDLYQEIISLGQNTGEYSLLSTIELSRCHQGDKAVEMVRRSLEEKNPYSVIFMDINMPPGPDGIWTAKEIRKIDMDVGIVLVTGQSRINILETARMILPADKLLYLQKPFFPQEILQFTSAFCEKWIVEKKYRAIRSDLEQRVESRTRSLLEANTQLSKEIENRIQMQNALRLSEENFRKLITNNSDGILILNETGSVLFINPAAETLFRLSSHEIVNRRFEYPYKINETSEIEISINREVSVIAELSTVETEWERKKAFMVSVRDISERKRMENEISLSLMKLRKAMEGTIKAMATVVETRDPYTAGHQQRVAQLCHSIGKEVKLESGQIEGIYFAGLIHDIGKISIPAEILSKPGRLSSAEFNLILVHPQAGYEILKEIQFPWPIAEITLQHHERMDGSGYPRGLKGDDILFEARIMCVADVVEAMATHRPYRPALGISTALSEISKNRGKLYDPRVVDACIAIFEKGELDFLKPL
ncbi:MAG: HD domain-containing phosphohydrolase [Thermodesulfobacteriota bacterium]